MRNSSICMAVISLSVLVVFFEMLFQMRMQKAGPVKYTFSNKTVVSLTVPIFSNKTVVSLAAPTCIFSDNASKTALLYSQFEQHYGDHAVWREGGPMQYSNAGVNALPHTATWAREAQASSGNPPHWWPEGMAFRQFPMLDDPHYDEGLWCPSPPTEVWTFHCVSVDSGSAHSSVIGGLATDMHIISHDSRMKTGGQCSMVYPIMAVPGTYYYPEAPGHFPNEILPRLLALHMRVSIDVPLLWPDTALARKLLGEMQRAGEFAGRSIVFHTTANGKVCIRTAYVYVFADDKAYRNNFAAATPAELRSVNALFRRIISDISEKQQVVFWTRKAGSPRSVSNMDEVRAALSGVNYVDFDPDKPYFEQAAVLLKGTRVFISPHGAGMTNVLFLEPGAAAVEIVYVDISYRCPEEYYCLCAAIGVEYYMTAAEGGYGSQLRVLFPREIAEIVQTKMEHRV